MSQAVAACTSDEDSDEEYPDASAHHTAADAAAQYCTMCHTTLRRDDAVTWHGDGNSYCGPCFVAERVPQERTQFDARMENSADVGTLRTLYPSHCAYHLFYYYILGRDGCRAVNDGAQRCTSDGQQLDHAVPQGFGRNLSQLRYFQQP
jgi:hypothetical protein